MKKVNNISLFYVLGQYLNYYLRLFPRRAVLIKRKEGVGEREGKRRRGWGEGGLTDGWSGMSNVLTILLIY